jgi:hypothetical protein
MRQSVVAIAFVTVLVATSVQADETDMYASRTTQTLYENCKSDVPIRAMACVSYIRGIFDAWGAVAQMSYDSRVPIAAQRWMRLSQRGLPLLSCGRYSLFGPRRTQQNGRTIKPTLYGRHLPKLGRVHL